ncbi:glycosyltransferase family 39 protein [Pseudomonas syringae]|uniref:glycosyltransferase family 39 protein n=1 Tax=Pseudomonas syringae TaxID=317 RepID=UPI003F7A35EC
MPENTVHPNPTETLKPRYQLMLAVVYFFVLILWSIGISFHGGPDESTHFFLLEYLKTFHELPSAAEPLQPFTGNLSGYTWHPGEFWYHGLPFPHVIGAMISSYGLSWLLPADVAYLSARCFNWILGAVFICALYRIAHRAGMTKRSAALSALIISLIPQVSFVFSYFNSDAYGLTSIALLLSSLLGYLKTPTKYSAVCFGAALGLMFLAKLYFLPALVFAGVMLIAYRHIGEQRAAKLFPLSLMVAVLISAPMLIITYIKYGEITGISGQLDFVAMHKFSPAQGFGTCYIKCTDHFINMTTILPWLNLATKSYFSVTGWMNVYIPDSYYMGAALLLIAITLTAIFQTARAYTLPDKKKFILDNLLPLIMILGLFPSIIIFSLIASQNTLPQPQGRYLFVTIPFLAIIIAIATTKRASNLTSASITRTARSRQFHMKWLFIVTLWMAWTNLVAWSANTLSQPNLQKSAIGRPLSDAVQETSGSINSAGAFLSASELPKRLHIDGGEFFLKAPVSSAILRGNVDVIRQTSEGLFIRGWSYIEPNDGIPLYVIAVEEGKILGTLNIDGKRQDVAAAIGEKSALRTGYEGTFLPGFPADKCDLKLYTVSSSFKIFAMPDVCASISRLSH